MRSDVVVLQATELPEQTEAALAAQFTTLRLPKPGPEREALLTQSGSAIRAIASTGKGPVDAALIAALPNLEIISAYSAGLDGVDVAAAAERGIVVRNTSHILADEVADLALWLIISVTRRLPQADRFIREGGWENGTYPLGLSIAGLKVGILGLGHIGSALTRRLDVMGADVAYNGRSRKAGCSYAYHAELKALAAWCDVLVVCCPGGDETRHLVDREILSALGPAGFLVNISRGSVVDEDALVAALEANLIAGAGLDVFANEPRVPEALKRDERVVLLPHIGSATTQTRTRMGESMIEELVRHFQEAESGR